MLFQKRFWAGIRNGSVTITFRRWKRRRVVAGRRYRTAAGIVEVTSVAVVAVDRITDGEAVLAGYGDAATLVRDLPGAAGDPVYRVVFHIVDEPDPRHELAHSADLTSDEVAAVGRRLERLDQRSSHGRWTLETLRAIRERPAVRAGDLAESLGRERMDFKVDVRKLKNLGLTLSLPVGYELSPRGAAYLDAVEGDVT